jgi:hypothetical protein
MRPPQLGHTRTSIANTRCISSAQRGLRSVGGRLRIGAQLFAGAQLLAANDPIRNAALAAVIAATSPLLGGGPRPSFTTYARMLA